MKRQIRIRLLSVAIHLTLACLGLFLLILADEFIGLLEELAIWVTCLPLAITISVLHPLFYREGKRGWEYVLFSLGTSGLFTIIWILINSSVPENPFTQTSFPLGILWFPSATVQLIYLNIKASNDWTSRSKRKRLALYSPLVIIGSIGICVGLIYAKTAVEEYYTKPTEVKLNRILKSDNIHVRYEMYGGYAGYSESSFHFIKEKYDSLVILEEGTKFQTYKEMDTKKFKLLETSLKTSLKNHDPDLELHGDCSHFSHEVYVRGGLTIIRIKPTNSDTIFWKLTHE